MLREDGHGVSAPQLDEGFPDGGHQVAFEVLLDQVGDHLGVGLRDEDMTPGLQVTPELGKVFDDPVVDDHDLPGAVCMRVGVDDRGTAVGRPAGVADAEVADRHFFRNALDQGVDLGGALYQGCFPVLVVEDRDARRVVPTVLEPLQALDDDGRGLALAQVPDDPAHIASYLPIDGRVKRTN